MACVKRAARDSPALRRRPELEPVHQLGVEARDSKPGDGVHHQRVDVLERDAGIGDRRERHLFQQLKCMALKNFGARLPAVALVVPILGLAGEAILDPGIGVEPLEPGEMREHGLRPLGDVVLRDSVLRNPRGDAGNRHFEGLRLETVGACLGGGFEHGFLVPSLPQ